VNAEAPRILGSASCGQHVIRPASATRRGRQVLLFKCLSKVELAACLPPRVCSRVRGRPEHAASWYMSRYMSELALRRTPILYSYIIIY